MEYINYSKCYRNECYVSSLMTHSIATIANDVVFVHLYLEGRNG